MKKLIITSLIALNILGLNSLSFSQDGSAFDKGSLVVTEKNGLAKAWSAINFVVMDNKQKFEYNKNNAVKAGLKTGDGLNSLAIVID